MRFGLGQIAPNENQRSMAWSCFFQVIKEEARHVLESLHNLLPQYSAAIRVVGRTPEMIAQIKEKYPDSTDFRIKRRPEWAPLYMGLQKISKGERPHLEAESVVLAESIADWQREYNLTGVVAFERAFGLLEDWSFGELKEEMPIYNNFGSHWIPTNLPQPPVYAPPYMTAEAYKELNAKYMSEVEASYATLDYPDNGKWRQVKTKAGIRDFKLFLAYQVEKNKPDDAASRYATSYPKLLKLETNSIERAISRVAELLGVPLR